MIRAIAAGLGLAVAALFTLLLVCGLVSVPGWTAGLHPDCNVTMPCAPAASVKPTSSVEARRIARGQYLEERLPFGRAVAPGERASEILGGRPSGCPRRFCGCGVSLKVFGRIIPDLNLAANWKRFASTTPGAGTVAWRPGHVLFVEAHMGGTLYQVYDPNSGGGKIRRHIRNLAGYRFVDPSRPA